MIIAEVAFAVIVACASAALVFIVFYGVIDLYRAWPRAAAPPTPLKRWVCRKGHATVGGRILWRSHGVVQAYFCQHCWLEMMERECGGLIEANDALTDDGRGIVLSPPIGPGETRTVVVPKEVSDG